MTNFHVASSLPKHQSNQSKNPAEKNQLQIFASCILSGKSCWWRSWQNKPKDSRPNQTPKSWLAYNQVIIDAWKQNCTFFSFVVNILDFNLVLGLEANSSADPESKLVFQVVVLECKVPAYWFNITLITTNVSRTFLTQTVVGLASSAPHQTPMWGLPLPPVAPSRMRAQPPFGNRTTRSFTRASTFRWISNKPMSGS